VWARYLGEGAPFAPPSLLLFTRPPAPAHLRPPVPARYQPPAHRPAPARYQPAAHHQAPTRISTPARHPAPTHHPTCVPSAFLSSSGAVKLGAVKLGSKVWRDLCGGKQALEV